MGLQSSKGFQVVPDRRIGLTLPPGNAGTGGTRTTAAAAATAAG